MGKSVVNNLKIQQIFIRNIDYLTYAHGAKVEDICKALNYSSKFYYDDMIIGEILPTFTQIEKLANLYNVNPNELLDKQLGMKKVDENGQYHYRCLNGMMSAEGDDMEYMSEVMEKICYFISLTKLNPDYAMMTSKYKIPSF